MFWQTYRHCLQTSLFVTLSRIFDRARDAHTIHTLVSVTLANLDLFSAAALGLRKWNGGPKPWWFDEYIAKAWIPASPDSLRHFQTELAPRKERFEKIYRPIRHNIYAHRLMSDAQAGAQLFGDTSRDEVGAILDFLHDLIETIRELYINGHEPELGKRDFREDNQRIRDSVARVLRSLH